MLVEITFIFRVYWLLKNQCYSVWFMCSKRHKVELIRRKITSVDFSLISAYVWIFWTSSHVILAMIIFFRKFGIIFRVLCEFFWNFWDCLNFSVNFWLNNVFAFFCTIREQKQFGKKYIYVPCDCLDFSVYLFLILGVFSVLILFLELGCLGVVLFLIFS